MQKNYLIDYNLDSVKNAIDMTQNIEKLLKGKRIIDQSRFLTEDNITYSYLVKTTNEKVKYNIIVNRNDEAYKAKFDILYFKTKSKLKSMKLFKTKVAACVIAAGIGVTAYNLPNIKNFGKNIVNNSTNKVGQIIDDSRKADGIYTKTEWDERLNEIKPNTISNGVAEEDIQKANQSYYSENEIGQLEKMMQDINEKENGGKGLN